VGEHGAISVATMVIWYVGIRFPEIQRDILRRAT
jgi:hypothetical protein